MWGVNSSASKAQIVLTFPRGNGTQSQPLRIEFVPQGNQEQPESDENEKPFGIIPGRQSQLDLEKNREKCRERKRQSIDQQRNGNQPCNCMQDTGQQAYTRTSVEYSRDCCRKSREIPREKSCEPPQQQPRRGSKGSQSSLWKREDKGKGFNNNMTLCSLVNKRCSCSKNNDASTDDRRGCPAPKPRGSRSSSLKKGNQHEVKNQSFSRRSTQQEGKNESSSGKGNSCCPLSVEIHSPTSSPESSAQGKENCDYLCSEFRVCAPPPPPDMNHCTCNTQENGAPENKRSCGESCLKVIAGDSCITLCSSSSKAESKKKKKKEKKKETRKELPVSSKRKSGDNNRSDVAQDDSGYKCSKKAKITFSSEPDCRCAESFSLAIVAKRDNELSEDDNNSCKVTQQVLQLATPTDRSCQMDICLPTSAKSKPSKPTNRVKKPACPPQSPCRSLPIPISKQALNYMPSPRICELAQPLVRDSQMCRPLPTPVSPCALSYVASERIKELAEPRPDLSMASCCSFKDCHQYKDFDGESQDEEDELLVVNCEDCGGNGSERLFIIQCIPK